MCIFKTTLLFFFLSITSLFFIGCSQNGADGKPVIYLYPMEEEIINVKLDYDGELTSTYPTYNDGWTVKAKPNGTLTNLEDNNYAKLEITPKPDSILRVMMIYKALNKPIKIKEQELKQFERTGFSVIEWGGR